MDSERSNSIFQFEAEDCSTLQDLGFSDAPEFSQHLRHRIFLFVFVFILFCFVLFLVGYYSSCSLKPFVEKGVDFGQF